MVSEEAVFVAWVFDVLSSSLWVADEEVWRGIGIVAVVGSRVSVWFRDS